MPHDAKGHKRYDFGMKRLRGIGFGVAIVALTVGIIAGVVTAVQHIPKPAKKIEWVRRADSIIVQMKDVGGLPQPEIADRATVPNFTLYGDGTLIFTQPSERGQFSSTPLRQATMSADYMQHLLKFIDDEGFLSFNYEQPKLGVYDFPTTFLYVNTKESANAVRAYALDAAVAGDAGKEWDQFHKLQEIKDWLDNIASAAAEDGSATEYSYDAILLAAQKIPASTTLLPPGAWPFQDISLSAIVGNNISGERQLSGEQARQIAEVLNKGDFFLQGDQFAVFYRPVLPYEENFPEFDTTE